MNDRDVEKIYTATKMNSLGKNFRAMKEARVKQARDQEIFALDKQQKQLEIEKMQNDPTIDPGYRSIVQKKIKLGQKEADLAIKKQEKALEYATYDTQQQMQVIGQKAKMLNQMTLENPEMFGDMMIVPDLETGQVTLKERKSNNDNIKTSDIVKSLNSYKNAKGWGSQSEDPNGKNYVPKDPTEVQLETLLAARLAKAQSANPNLGSADGVPDWVPKGKEEHYKNAKKYDYSDDELKQYYGK